MTTRKLEQRVREIDREYHEVNTQHALAKEFSRVLRSWLTPEEMAKVIQLNATPQYHGCCASHDFCDSNMAMDEAFTKIVGHECDADVGLDAVTWSKAWDIAVKSEFATK